MAQIECKILSKPKKGYTIDILLWCNVLKMSEVFLVEPLSYDRWIDLVFIIYSASFLYLSIHLCSVVLGILYSCTIWSLVFFSVSISSRINSMISLVYRFFLNWGRLVVFSFGIPGPGGA